MTRTHEDGRTSRPLYSLGTADKTVAHRKLAKLVADLAVGRDAESNAGGSLAFDTVLQNAERWLEMRAAQGVVSAADERRNLVHVLPAIGHLQLSDVRSSQVRAILEEMLTKPRERAGGAVSGHRTNYSRETITHVRGVMHRLFDAAWRAELIESNPVARVRAPVVREHARTASSWRTTNSSGSLRVRTPISNFGWLPFSPVAKGECEQATSFVGIGP